jgi:hypothetical protein
MTQAHEDSPVRERGFRAAWRFYRQHFRSVFVLSLLFYLVIAVLVAVAILQLDLLDAFVVGAYLIVASIIWLQAPLARLVDDVRLARPNPGARRTLAELGPRLGSINGGTFVAAEVTSYGFRASGPRSGALAFQGTRRRPL